LYIETIFQVHISIQNHIHQAAIFAFHQLFNVGYLNIAITGTKFITINLISASQCSQNILNSSDGSIFSSIKIISFHNVSEYFQSKISTKYFLNSSWDKSLSPTFTKKISFNFFMEQIIIHFHLLHLFGFTTKSCQYNLEKS